MPLFPVEAEVPENLAGDPRDWVKVGQSYNSGENSSDPRRGSDTQGTRSSISRCKAADFFCADEKSSQRKRSRSPSDDTDSDWDKNKRHHKRGRKAKDRVSTKVRKKGKSRKSHRCPNVRPRNDGNNDEELSRSRSDPGVSRGQQRFVEDRRGDLDNLSFGGFYRLDVPLYDGVGDSARRQSRGSREPNVSRYFSGQAQSANGGRHQARLQLWKGDKRRDHAVSWTRAVSSPKLSREVGIRLGHKEQRASADFLPVHPVVLSLDENASRTDPTATRDDVDTENLEQWVARKTKEFNVKTRTQPHCEAIWLQFADFQGEAVRALHGGGPWQPSTAAMVHMALEKQASVLEGALRRNPSSIRLLTANLQVAEQLQDHSVVDSIWRGAIETSSHSCTLWLRYLQFKASHFSSFTVPSQRSLYDRCIRALESKREGAFKTEEQEQQAKGVFILAGRSMLGNSKEKVLAEQNLLDVLWSYCMMERAAGFQERALGVLQAMVELNIQSSSSAVSMDTFVSFWDGEAPRIGDMHPGQAGLSRWREAAGTASAKPSGSALQLGNEETAGARKPQLVRQPAGRGRRKRAADFFKEELQPTRRKQPQPVIAGTEVLEKAYHAAMALTTAPVPRVNAPQRADTPGDVNDLLEDSDSRSRSRGGSSPDKYPGFNVGETPGNTIAPGAAGRIADANQGSEGDRAVEAEGLIWMDASQRTAYSVRHGYRIDVQGAQDSVSGLEYGRILSQMRGGADEHGGKDGGAVSAAFNLVRSRGAREREEEMARQATVLEHVAEGDPFSVWSKIEDEMTRDQWQPLRSTQDTEKAEEQPDRVVLIEDLRPYLFSLSQPSSLRALIGFLLSVGGLVHPRSDVSHSLKLMSEASCAGSFGDGGLSCSLLSSVSNGLQTVWTASGAHLPVSGKGVVECTGRPGSCLPPMVVSTAADQFLLLTDEVIREPSRQAFLRNILHHLVRAPESLPTADEKSSMASGSNAWVPHSGDILVQLQCTLIVFEGYLAAAAGARHGRFCTGNQPIDSIHRLAAWSDEDTHGHEARKVAKSLLEASQASATDLRLWCSYVQLLALLGSTQEATKVAEKALSLVQALPDDKKPHSAELFWLTFRIHAGLPLSPLDSHSGVDSAPGESDIVGNLFDNNQCHENRESALLVLCSFAEGEFKRPKSTKSKREGKRSRPDALLVSPPRLMAARKIMSDRVTETAAEEVRKGPAEPRPPGGALDMTPPLMYLSVAWVWLEYLTGGLDAAEDAMSKCLDLVQPKTNTATASETIDPPPDAGGSSGIGGTLAGNKPYQWKVMPEYAALGVCLERMHRSFSELLVLAQRYNPVETAPRKVRAVLLRGLRSFPAEPGMLCMLLNAEQFSSSQQRLVHHLAEVSRRRVLTWEQGPTPPEWMFLITHQVLRCVREARQNASFEAAVEHGDAIPACRRLDVEALHIKNWLPGSYSRLKRSLESAVTHPTGRGIPVLWRMYMSLEAMRGNNIQAKRLYWRAIHACPGNKSVWMDAVRGNNKQGIGAAGLRPAFRTKELNEAIDAMLEKAIHLRGEPQRTWPLDNRKRSPS